MIRLRRISPARLATLFALALLTCLATASAASALTASQADRIALRTLRPQRLTDPVVVFGSGTRLPAGTTITQDAPDGPRPAW